ncbi:hypothetical protein DALLNEIH_01536 [Bacillus sp. B01(2024)]
MNIAPAALLHENGLPFYTPLIVDKETKSLYYFVDKETKTAILRGE